MNFSKKNYNTIFKLNRKRYINKKSTIESPIETGIDSTIDKKYKIGIYSIFIGSYKVFYKTFIENILEYFLPDHEKIFYIVTDDINLPKYDDNTYFLYRDYIGWPYETLYRFKYFLSFKNINADIIYFLNGNARCTEKIKNNILPDPSLNNIVCALHCLFKDGYNFCSYEQKSSTACILFIPDKNYYYYTGSFYGATKEKFIELCNILNNNTDIDEKNNYIAVWHDESHLNYYINMILNNNVKKLDRSYHAGENIIERSPTTYKLLLLDKTKYIKNFSKGKSQTYGDIIKNKYNIKI